MITSGPAGRKEVARVPKKILMALTALALCALLAGCLKSTEELYTLPQQSDEYYELQRAIDGVLVGGAVYSAPLGGANQQAVQLADLDADGEDEAIAFVKTTDAMPLKAYIFDKTGSGYERIAVIEGNGSSFESVEYAQIDGEPGLDVVIGWQVSDQVLKAIAAYSLRDDGLMELMSASYSAYKLTDLDQDGLNEVFLVRQDTAGQSGVAELYSCAGGVLERAPEAQMTGSAASLRRIVTGYMDTGVPAIFVASTNEESYIITDVFAISDGVFQNIIFRDAESGSAAAVRNYYVYATDIDLDGLIELPNPVELTNVTADAANTYWAIQWYNLTLEGDRIHKQTTYHNISGGWFLTLQDDWNSLVVFRGNPVGSTSGYVFALWPGEGELQELFTIYSFSGENAASQAQSDGRFLLAQKGETVYAAALGDSSAGLTEQMLQQMFHFIQEDWNTGEM